MTAIILIAIAVISLLIMTFSIIGIASERERKKINQMFEGVDRVILRDFLGNKK